MMTRYASPALSTAPATVSRPQRVGSQRGVGNRVRCAQIDVDKSDLGPLLSFSQSGHTARSATFVHHVGGCKSRKEAAVSVPNAARCCC